MISSEVTPFAQTGGLAEVLAALPSALVGLGLEVDVLMPMYRGITPDKYPLEKIDLKINLVLNDKKVSAEIWQLRMTGGHRQLFLKCNEYYDREGLYGTADANFPDNAERFVFLSRAALEMSIASGIRYDIFHSHNWQASLTPVYLRTFYVGEKLFAKSASVMTIHNLGYQGIFWHLDMPLVGVGWEFFTPKYMEFHGNVNFLKSGIVFSDKVNTVSPGYRNEILTSEYGFGLEGVLQEKKNDLHGILNGVDYHVWNPETDLMIAARYSTDDFSGKMTCKADLQRLSGFEVRPDVPLVAMVSRLSNQKGVDLFEGAFQSLVNQDLQFIILGTGESRYVKHFKSLVEKHPGKFAAFLNYDYELSHRIFAGADIMLVPSRYEPCGLNQLYAMKYGAVPIVRSTGGLKDTVSQISTNAETGTGFVFTDAHPTALASSIMDAVNLYRSNPSAWRKLMVRIMNQNFSWEHSAKEYIKLYEQSMDKRKPRG